MKKLKWIGLVFILLILFYVVGPTPSPSIIDTKPLLMNNQLEIQSLDSVLLIQEQVANLKPLNNAHIVWNDSVNKKKTPYSIVYIHGFSASHAEGYPIHEHLAEKFGCNLYLSRLYAHGLNEPEPLLKLRTEEYIQSAKEAIRIGKIIGDSVILVSTSTGSTLSLMLAANEPVVAGLIMYSPNIDLYDSKSFLLTKPWGLQLVRRVLGDNYYTFEASREAQKYWNTKYRIEALIVLKSMIEKTMHEQTFQHIHVPVFVAYYYKDAEHQDDVVSVPRMQEMFDQLATPNACKRMVNFPDAGTHIIGSSYWNKNTQPLEDSTILFLEQVMKLQSVN
jgi:pimeloyl-ACP methyl ester carboxylesterase